MVLNFWGPALRHFVGSKSCPTQCRHHSSAGQEVFPKPSGHCPLQIKIQHRNLKTMGKALRAQWRGPCLPECCCKPWFFYFLGIEIPNWNIFSQKITRLPLVNTLKNRTLFECNFTLNSRSIRKWIGKVFGTCRATQPPWQFETRLHIIPEPQCTVIFKGASSKWSALPCTTSWQFWGAFRFHFKNFGDLVKMSLKLYVMHG